MKLGFVEMRRIRMPLVTAFETSFGTENVRDILLVAVGGPDGVGWGESAAMSEPGYSSEYVDGAQHVIVHHMLPRLFAASSLRAEAVGPLLSGIKGHPMAKTALEMAILDLELRGEGRSFASYFGAVRDRVPSGVSVGIMDTIPELLDAVAAYLEQGYLRIKLKIKPGWDIEPVAAVRERFGDGIALQVDANTAYTIADAEHLAQLDAFGLLLIEQPMAEEDIAGHAVLARRLDTPICLDESITSAAAAIDAIARGACSIVNIKAGRVGGYLEARRIHDVCAERGVPVWCGGMLETGLGRAANVALAALPNFSLPGDTSASARYWTEDITAPFELVDGCLAVPGGPGLGVEPDPVRLHEVTTTFEKIPWGG